MTTEIFLAIAMTLLVVSVAANIAFYVSRHRFESRWLLRETRALDQAHASELRAASQIDAMLERVSTAPRMVLDRDRNVPVVNPDERKFYADDDDPVEERAWNEYRGATDEATT